METKELDNKQIAATSVFTANGDLNKLLATRVANMRSVDGTASKLLQKRCGALIPESPTKEREFDLTNLKLL